MRILLSFLLLASAALAQTHVITTRVSKPEKALRWEVIVPSNLDEVWAAFTTSDGLSTWLTPNAVVDPRAGGEWTAKFPGGGTGGGTILSLTPKSEIVMRAMAPPMFPHVREERTRAEWRFTEAGPHATKIVLTQTGWKQGEEWEKAYAYLEKGNAQLLETLYRRFETGPIDWAKEWGPQAK